MRSKQGGYSILEPEKASPNYASFHNLGWPTDMLLCTEGYERAVNHYELLNNQGLMRASLHTEQVLQQIRLVEAQDPDCRHYVRFKPADDATALRLQSMAGGGDKP